MVEIKTGDKIIGDSSEHWIFGGYVNDNTISIIYYKRKYQHLTHSIHSFSSNYYYRIEIGTRINLPHSEKKTYVAEIKQKDNVIYLKEYLSLPYPFFSFSFPMEYITWFITITFYPF